MVRFLKQSRNIYHLTLPSSIYGHRLKKTRHPVRSAKVKFQIDLSVVGVGDHQRIQVAVYFCGFLHSLYVVLGKIAGGGGVGGLVTTGPSEYPFPGFDMR